MYECVIAHLLYGQKAAWAFAFQGYIQGLCAGVSTKSGCMCDCTLQTYCLRVSATGARVELMQ